MRGTFLMVESMNIERAYSLFRTSTGVSIDTRTLQKGNIFVAIKGEQFDGNQYAERALEKGAHAVFVSDSVLDGHDKRYQIDNGITFLQRLAKLHRDTLSYPIIALTGSNGKTTTKELLLAVLSQTYRVQATKGNLNNHIGIPLTILSFRSDLDMGIVEMGANHLEEIASYCTYTKPTHGLITNIGKAHIGEFGSASNIFQAKTELFEYLKEENGIIFDGENNVSLSDWTSEYSNCIAWSALDIEIQLNSMIPSIALELRSKSGHSVQISSSLGAKYNFENIKLALLVGRAFNMSLESLKLGIESYNPTNNRSQWLETSRNMLYLDAYNANPTSMQHAIDYFVKLPNPSKVLILGDMKELGAFSNEEHIAIFDHVVQLNHFDNIIFIGPEFCHALKNIEAAIPENIFSFQDVRACRDSGLLLQIQNKTILMKGSRSIGLETIADQL